MMLSTIGTGLFHYQLKHAFLSRKSSGKAILIAAILIISGALTLQAQNSTSSIGTLSEDISSYMAVQIAPHSHFGATPTDFNEVNGTAIFTLSFSSPPSLWFSNGFDGGTYGIEFPDWDNIDLGSRNSATSGDRFYFSARIDGGWEVWSTDGTVDGTRVEAIGSDDDFFLIREMIPYGDGVAFVGFSSTESLDRVYLINSNTTGAMKVTGVERVFNGGVPPRILVYNDLLYVVESSGTDRYLTTVTETGAANRSWQMPNNGGSDFRSIYSITQAGNYIFFVGNDSNGFSLWAYQGGSAVSMFSPDPEDEQHRNVRNLTAVGDRVYFFSQPWNDENNDFSFGNGLYYSTGSGTTRLFSEDLGLIDGQDALNLGMASAGDYLVFTTPSSSDPGRVWWRAGTTSSSVQPLSVDGSHIGIASAIRGSFASIGHAAWISNGNLVFYTDGTNGGTIEMEPEDLKYVRNMGLVGDKPWFAARTSTFGNSTAWRIGEEIIPPPQVTLSSPHSNATGVSLMPELSWNDADGFERYRIHVSTSPYFHPVLVDSLVNKSAFEFTENLAAGTTHYWRVRVEDPMGIGEWSQTRNFVTETPPEPPAQVTLTSPVSDADSVSLRTVFEWDAVAEADSFQLQLTTNDSFTHPVLDTLTDLTQLTPDTVLDELTEYWWRVRASNDAGAGDWSETWHFTTEEDSTTVEPEPLPVITLSSPDNNAQDISLHPELNWYRPSEIDSFSVQLSTNDQFTDVVMDSILSDTTAAPIELLEEGATYWWRVRSVKDSLQSDWSETWQFTTKVPTGSDLRAELPLELELAQNYPNPFNPSTTISYALPESSHVVLDVFDMLGRRVAVLVNEQVSAGRYQIHFDASRLTSGTYLYRLQVGSKTLTQSMVLVK